MLGIFELVHFSRDELAFAMAAISVLAGKRKCEPGAQERGEQSVGRLYGHGIDVADEDDLHGLAPELTMPAILCRPNKTCGSDRFPPSSVTACASLSRRCSATSARPSVTCPPAASASCFSSRP